MLLHELIELLQAEEKKLAGKYSVDGPFPKVFGLQFGDAFDIDSVDSDGSGVYVMLDSEMP